MTITFFLKPHYSNPVGRAPIEMGGSGKKRKEDLECLEVKKKKARRKKKKCLLAYYYLMRNV